MPTPDQLARAESLIALTPDCPTRGVLFRDIGPMLEDADALAAVTEALAAPFEGGFDLVAGVEARGFLLAGTMAATARTGLLPVRKAGKTPRPTASVDYALEYGVATIEAAGDLSGRRVLLVDDVLATGGTLGAAARLVEELGGEVAGVAVVLELSALGGRERVPATHAVFRA
ncbi:adenine phosphoribosyltransferase [Agrococcus sp. Marseille-Q4369]|uniref:adenine phosphoribosyltransferase n=1 Tax=Agrococcus sp. Marseille-Q4369 TaxID=2810513 RepID=UPI001B8C7DF8|nr:adenine phosphoribosyltransferase [Agrococcus sp. Marseille-Q4369]QUW20149.1 adenine phosphoribosyltransferase [Agrococcus sp. Marseille-Q4369]